MRITVLSTFDIWPARDGGQNRYVNLWQSFSKGIEIRILVYDFRRTSASIRYRLSDTVEVIVPRAHPSDAELFHRMNRLTGLWLHDVLCVARHKYSSDFLSTLRDNVSTSDIVVASHPYLAGVAFPLAGKATAKIYESHNVEYDIKREYLATSTDLDIASCLLNDVRLVERWASTNADAVTAVSKSDAIRFADLYGLTTNNITIIPNGTSIVPRRGSPGVIREEIRSNLGIGQESAGIFLGSAFSANVESYRRSRMLLHQSGFRGKMLLVGSICQAPRQNWPDVDFEEIWFGYVDDVLRDALLRSADFALQMIFSGAGTNLKIFDYMAAGVPIIANRFGRRGIDSDGLFIEAEDEHDLAKIFASNLLRSDHVALQTGRAQEAAVTLFSWKAVARRFEDLINSLHQIKSMEVKRYGGHSD